MAGPGGDRRRRDGRAADAGGSRPADRWTDARARLPHHDRGRGPSRRGASPSSRNSSIRRRMRCRESKRSGRLSRRIFAQPATRAALEASRSSCRCPAPPRAASAAAPSSTASREASTPEPTSRPRPARRSSRPIAAASRSPPISIFPGKTIIIDHGLGVVLLPRAPVGVRRRGRRDRRARPADRLSGATGRVTGPHLHWTMRFGSARVDPLSLVEVVGASGDRNGE